MMRRFSLLAAACGFLLVGCETPPPQETVVVRERAEPPKVACLMPAKPYQAYRLYFGRALGPAGEVTDAQWEDFLADVVTPRFPSGLTVLDGRGQWRDPGGVVKRERSKVLVILVPVEDTAADARVRDVATLYKSRFNQQSVLVTEDVECAEF